ncbi:MAG: hypothetical protein L6R40_002485 [Gallowayella cf. fulva]|nr:MAG: hypothetical protein L6R40_002485 [Xanthomendoza cf. fulva]
MTETPHDKLSVSRDNHPTSVQKDVEERKPEAVEDGNAGHGQLSAKNEVEYVTGWRFIAIAIAIVLSMFLASLDLTIIATAIPQITNQFHSLDQVGWYGSALFLTVAATQGVWGQAFKYFPIKIVYLLSIFIFELGSLICGPRGDGGEQYSYRISQPVLENWSIAGNFYILLYYLPIYFQAVRGVDATNSGVRSLPLILGLTLVQIITGIAIGSIHHYVPFMVLGGTISTVATGMFLTLNEHSGHSVWIGYQALAGIGLGLCFTVPIIVVQAAVDYEDVSTATAVILFFQSLGGALIVSAGQSLFQNFLLATLRITNPDLDPAVMLNVGAADIQKAFPAAELVGINRAYMKGLHRAFTLAIPMAGIATLLACVQKWQRLKKASSVEQDRG